MNENNKKTYTSAEMREAADTFWVGGVICEVKDAEGRVVRHIKDDVIKAMLRQAADLQDDNTRLSTELRLAHESNLAKDEKERILKSRIDNAERKVMDLRKELYKFGPKELYDMTAVILDALKGRGTAK